MRPRLAFPLALSLLLGCSSSPGPSQTWELGEIVLINPDATYSGELNSVIFGATYAGNRKKRSITVRNDGKGPFFLESVTLSGPDAVAFSVEMPPVTKEKPTFEVAPGHQVEIPLWFQPRLLSQRSATAFVKVLRASKPGFELKLSGFVLDGCATDQPLDLDFGNAVVGATTVRELELVNPAPVEWTVWVKGILSGAGSSSFFLGPDFEPGEHVVPAAAGATPGVLAIPLVFNPRRSGPLEASLALPLGPGCDNRTVLLRGTGLDAALSCGVVENGEWREQVHFGYVALGVTLTRSLTCKNLGSEEIEITLGTLTQHESNAFSIVGDQKTFPIPAAGTVAIELAFAPTLAGIHSATLAYSSTDPHRATGKIALSGTGGGPVLAVEPAALSFGKVAVHAAASRRLRLKNAGSDAPGTEKDNLRLETPDAQGVWRERLPEIIGSSEFELDLPLAGYPPSGLPAGIETRPRIRFKPRSAGAKTATLRIYSNDPVTPVLDVGLSGEAVSLPECELAVHPPELAFGMVSPEKGLTMHLALSNPATDPGHQCLISGMEIAPADGPFRFMDAPLEGVFLGGGESVTVPVRFRPDWSSVSSADLVVFVSSAASPERVVPMHGTPGDVKCLFVSPREVDLGAAVVGCYTSQRTVTLFNVCAAPLMVTAADLQPGSSSDIELAKPPSFPVTLQKGGRLELGVRHAPPRAGAAAAGISVAVQGTGATLVVPIHGVGTSETERTDTFTQPPRHRLDLLIVIKNSPTMQDKVPFLAQNFRALLSLADSLKIDYQIAVVTTTGFIPAGGDGHFLPLDKSRPRIVTPATDNRHEVFAANVDIPLNGPLYETRYLQPVQLALSSPLKDGHNAGFLRSDARLGVLLVGDGRDWDDTAVSFYADFLWLLKEDTQRQRVRVSAAVPASSAPTVGCWYVDAPGSMQRIREVVDLTGGNLVDVCSSTWGDVMGLQSLDSSSAFHLSARPQSAEAISVAINGIEFAQYAGTQKRWDYKPESNALVFPSHSAPEPGYTVTARYVVKCD